MPARSIAVALLLFALPLAAERPKPIELKLESRRVLVSLPASYKNDDQRYPVLYVLDADAQLEHTVASADALAAVLRIPDLIIVGVTHTDRQKDLTPNGGADRFGELLA